MFVQEKSKINPAEIFENLVDSLKRVLVTPAKFFADMPAPGRYQGSIFFLLFCHLAAGLFSFLSGGDIVDLIGFPVFGFLSALLAALIIDYLGREVFDADVSYEKSFQIVSYSSCVILFSFIPVLRFLVAFYGLYLVVTGIQTIYSVTTGKAVVTVILTLLGINLLRFILPWIVTISPFGLFS